MIDIGCIKITTFFIPQKLGKIKHVVL